MLRSHNVGGGTLARRICGPGDQQYTILGEIFFSYELTEPDTIIFWSNFSSNCLCLPEQHRKYKIN